MTIAPQDLNLSKIFGVQLFLIANAAWHERIRLALRALVSVIVKRPVLPPAGEGALFFNSYDRQDYIALLDKIYASCREPKVCWQLRLTWGFNLEAFRLCFSELPHWRAVTALAGRGIAERIFLYLFWIRCRQIGNLARRIRYTSLTVVCDVQLAESFLVQIANRRQLRTVTCQHGLYIDDGPALSPGNLNPANYLNPSAEYFLAWGARTKALMEKYSSCACIVVGNPTIPDVQRSGAADYFYVLTDADNRFRQYNEALLAIAAEASTRLGMPYFVQFHPDNDPRTYGNHPSATAGFPLENARFAIGHLTSQIFKAMRQGVPVYRLRSTVASHPLPDELLFSDCEDMLSKTVHPETFKSVSESYIAYIGEASMARHTQAFNMINAGDRADPKIPNHLLAGESTR
jgi:hypothetical protein